MTRPHPEDFLLAFDAMPGYRWLALRNAIRERDTEVIGALILRMMDDFATTPVDPPASSPTHDPLVNGEGRTTGRALTIVDELRRLGL